MLKIENTSKINELLQPPFLWGKSIRKKMKSISKKEKETPSIEEISFS